MSAPESATNLLLRVVKEGFAIERGHPLPLGATVRRGGVNFAVFSDHATDVALVIFHPERSEPLIELPLDPRINRTGNVWHTFLREVDPGIRYGFRMTRAPNEAPHLHRYQPDVVLIDPYAKALAGGGHWGEPHTWKSVIVDDVFDWGRDQPLNIPLSDSVIYELHVRGFTRHPSANVYEPGTYAGLAEKIPYLQALGVTAVELMPVSEFDETDQVFRDPVSGRPLLDYWGYDSIAFFAPKAAYAAAGAFGGQVYEFKEMVKRFHEAGIEVILDVVFNHTGEGDEKGKTTSFRGIDNSVYYMLDPQTGGYRNFSGCGNTVNCNRPVVRSLVLDCLRYWVTEMHVDGFRFDLASILGRGSNGEVLSNPPLLEHIAAEPVLANTKIIAEAWDAAGLYQVGSFPAWGRWAEWNGKFRDDVRRFLRGDDGVVIALAARISGSPDLYESNGRAPFHSINFVTCHDGFTLADLVSYEQKHNEANGENNADGSQSNFSWNCGAEGPTDDPAIRSLRWRQARNLITLLMVSHGTPMILAGDEMARTQRGNNNAYCQDNEVSWVDWSLAAEDGGLGRFFRMLIELRRRHPALRPQCFGDVGVTFHGVRAGQADWGWHSHSLAVDFLGQDGDEIYVIANAWREPLRFELPAPREGNWVRIVDTSLATPGDIGEAALADQGWYDTAAHTCVVLAATPLSQP